MPIWGMRPWSGDVRPFHAGTDALSLSYPRFYHTESVGISTPALVEPALFSSWAADTTVLTDANTATYYTASSGVSFPQVLVAAAADFGVNRRVTQVQVQYQAAMLSGIGTAAYALYTGVDNGVGGITWTLKSSASLVAESGAVPTVVQTLAVNFSATDCRYYKWVAIGNNGQVALRINNLSSINVSICDPPAKVLNLRWLGVCEGAQTTLLWGAAATATDYEIEITYQNGATALLRTGNVLSRLVAPTTVAQLHRFRVRAYNSCGAGGFSDQISVTPCSIVPPPVPQPPTAPTNLRGLGVCEGAQNTLRWDAGAVIVGSNATAHKFYVSINNGADIDVGNVTTWIHTPATLGVSYSYRVRAWNPDGYSPYSAAVPIASCTPPPPPPPSTSFAIAGYGHCVGARSSLWISPTTGGETYEIWRRSQMFPTGDGELVYSGALPTQTNPFHDEPLPVGALVSYRARAKNTGGYTDWTGWIDITPCIAATCDCPSEYVLIARCGDDCHCCCGDSCHCGEAIDCGDADCPASQTIVTSVDTVGEGGGVVVIGNGSQEGSGSHSH